jgi:4-nitrophenyl phosphatase
VSAAFPALATIEGVVSDMDGVLWRGNDPLPGLTELFHWLRAAGIPYALATNNSARSEAEYVAKLARMGVADVREGEIVSSRVVLFAHLRTHYPPGTAVFVVGEPGLGQAVAAAGFVLSEEAGVVAVGIDRAFTYERLNRAARLVRQGATFLATNADPTVPEGAGFVPGAGSIVAAISVAGGRAPLVLGKPALPIFTSALEVTATRPARTLMLGDRLDTDIAGARRAGMATALLLTGATAQVPPAPPDGAPDWVFPDLPALLAAWRNAR